MEYEISFALESSDKNPRREWTFLTTRNTLGKAKTSAKQVSKEKNVYEVEIRCENDGDLVHHSFWRNGKLSIDMCSS